MIPKLKVSVFLLLLTVLTLFVLMVGAGGVPNEPVTAAEGRQFAIMHIEDPTIVGTYNHPGLSTGGIKVIDMSFSVAAPAIT